MKKLTFMLCAMFAMMMPAFTNDGAAAPDPEQEVEESTQEGTELPTSNGPEEDISKMGTGELPVDASTEQAKESDEH